MRRVRLLLGIGVLLGCRGEQVQRVGAITERDSAGVEIVQHPAGFEASLPNWAVETTPLLDIGGSEEPGHDLFRVGGAVQLADGRIVVVNRGSSELRFFDSTGRYLRAAGRAGQGPGEFASLWSVQVLPGDTLFAFDAELRRGSYFLPQGEFLRTIPTSRHEERRAVTASALLENGLLLAEDRGFSEMRETSGPVRRDPYAIVLMEPQAESPLDTVAVVPDFERYPGLGSEGSQEFPTLRSLEFGRGTSVGTDGRRIFVGTNEPGGIQVFDDRGALVRIVRSATPPEPVTAGDRKRREQENLARLDQQRTVSEQVRERWKQVAANKRYADVFPYYERLLPGPDGTLWIEQQRRYEDEGRRFVVYDSRGRALAAVRCPERMRPYQVGPDRIIGMWRDPDEVQHVRVYRVSR